MDHKVEQNLIYKIPDYKSTIKKEANGNDMENWKMVLICLILVCLVCLCLTAAIIYYNCDENE